MPRLPPVPTQAAMLSKFPITFRDMPTLIGVDRKSSSHTQNDAFNPTETCRESYCLLSSTSFQGCSWGEIDLAQDSRDEPGTP
jgi:hypothetical protein